MSLVLQNLRHHLPHIQEQNKECLICLKDFKERAEPLGHLYQDTIQGSHIFHRRCLKKLFKTHAEQGTLSEETIRCPACRAKFTDLGALLSLDQLESLLLRNAQILADPVAIIDDERAEVMAFMKAWAVMIAIDVLASSTLPFVTSYFYLLSKSLILNIAAHTIQGQPRGRVHQIIHRHILPREPAESNFLSMITNMQNVSSCFGYLILGIRSHFHI